MHRIDPTSARLFVSIVEAGSIARAAAREHIVPSAVSRRLAELEAMFEVALVEREERLGGTCLLRGCIPSKALPPR